MLTIVFLFSTLHCVVAGNGCSAGLENAANHVHRIHHASGTAINGYPWLE